MSTAILCSIAYSNVDIVGCPGGNFVAWDYASGVVLLTEIEGGQDTLEFGLNCPTLGSVILNGEPRLLLATCSYEQQVADSLFLIDPSPLSSISSRAVASADLCWLSEPGYVEGSIRVARHQNETDAFYVSADAYLPCSGGMECNVMSLRFQYDATGGMYITDTLGVSIDSYAGNINSYSRPVCCATSTPAMFWSWHNGYMTPLLDVYAGIHQINGDPVSGDFEPMMHDCFYSDYCDGEVRAAGSCATEAAGFWTRSDDTELYYSVLRPGFACPDSLTPDPYGIPVLAAIALCSSPDDYGMLLVWQDGDEILCGHWDGEWNGYCHVVETGVSDLYNGNLAVCSVDSGYFVAWAAPEVPEIRFVPRDVVTSIEGGTRSPQPRNCIRISPNPVAAGMSINIRIDGSCTSPLELYDLNGRLLFRTEPDETGKASLDTSGMPPGTYILRCASEAGATMCKMILLGE
ncbi:MAG: T9SS type A sorting domain-containing protein [Candidatus Fermentibacteraceae bacterium]|nr:T9SS type A sorting domain-containing protein [Candidatus Fermentibacteraceae bacterium]